MGSSHSAYIMANVQRNASCKHLTTITANITTTGAAAAPPEGQPNFKRYCVRQPAYSSFQKGKIRWKLQGKEHMKTVTRDA